MDILVSENFNFKPILVGFKKKRKEVIPSYFEPLIKKNILHMCGSNERFYTNMFIFKGDGDSERPNRI